MFDRAPPHVPEALREMARYPILTRTQGSTNSMRTVYKFGYEDMTGNSFWKDHPSFTDTAADADQAPAR